MVAESERSLISGEFEDVILLQPFSRTWMHWVYDGDGSLRERFHEVIEDFRIINVFGSMSSYKNELIES